MSSDGTTRCVNDSDALSESRYPSPNQKRCMRYVCACFCTAIISLSHPLIEPLPTKPTSTQSLRLLCYKAARFRATEITYDAASSGVNPNEASLSKILRDQSHAECSATCLRRLTLRLELLSSLWAFQCPSVLTNSSSSSAMSPPTLCPGLGVSTRMKSVRPTSCRAWRLRVCSKVRRLPVSLR